MDKKIILLALVFSLILIGGIAFAQDVPKGQPGGGGPLTINPNTLGTPMGTPEGAPPTTERGAMAPLTIQPNTLGSPVSGK